MGFNLIAFFVTSIVYNKFVVLDLKETLIENAKSSINSVQYDIH